MSEGTARPVTDQPRSTADQSTPAARPHWWLLALVVALVLLADQATKAYVTAHLDLHESWMPLDWLEPVFRFTLVHNTGAAFGIFPGGGSIFLVIAVVVSSIIVFYYRQLPAGTWLVRAALGLQMGGALGNVIDRVRLGYVVDFFNVTHWPVFNVADSSIVVGVGLLMLAMVHEEWVEQRRRTAQAGDARDETPDAASDPAEERPSLSR